MKSMNRVFLLAAVIAITTFGFIKPSAAAGAATIAINPTMTSLSQERVGQTFEVNITVSDVTDLWDWKVRLNWNPQILNLTMVEEGPFLKSGGSTLFLWSQGAAQINEGYLPEIYCALFVASGVNGSGVLATVTFKVLTPGASAITMNETWLNTFSSPIAHSIVDGYVVIPVTFSAFGQEIGISSNSTITDFQFSNTSRKISFNVSGADGTKGFANVIFPKALLSGNLTVYLNQFLLISGVDYIMTSNATHYSLNVTYNHSTLELEIFGTEAIPEFTTILGLSLIMIGAGAVLITLKKENNRSFQSLSN